PIASLGSRRLQPYWRKIFSSFASSPDLLDEEGGRLERPLLQEVSMLYLVHGKNQKSNRVLRVHAETAAEAEAIGFKRGFFVSEVTEVASNDPRLTLLDRAGEMLWRCWRHTPRNAFKCF